MRNIAAVTQADANQYLSIALRHGEGDGYTGHYKYYIVQKEDGQYMAIFLDCYQELRTVRTFALVSLLVVAASIVQVYILVVLLSWRAIDPVVKNMEKQKQFITDSSHELKTPLTVITTSLKVLEMEVGQQKWIDKARSQADKMTELVNDLVTLSRLDEEKLPLQLNTFDISEAVSETAESFREFAAAHDHTLQLDIPGGFHYCGDEYAIRQLVSILMDNAVKYADGGTPINLRLEPAPKGILIKTCNFCTEMNPAEADKLFDRFYRADKARSRQATGGFGVGLSIARSIVEAHRGNIHAEWMEGGMLQFTAFLRA